MPVILATQEIEIKRIVVQGHARQKARDTISTHKLGMVAHTNHPK
jgi:hypothetical protein